MERSHSIIATPPGATIREQIVDRGMNQKELAARMGMSEKHISKLINGEVQLTMDTARRLEMVLGLPAQFWCNLETIYREKIAMVNEEIAMDEDIEIAKKMPYKEMARNGWVEDITKWSERVIRLRKYFEVAQLGFLQGNLVPGIACRKLSETEKSDYAMLAWAQKAKIEARKISTEPIDIATLTEKVPQIRKMTVTGPEYFCPRLKEELADCGVAIVFLPHIGGSFLHGATFLDGNKIVVGLTVRGKDADRFWFSLFHELAHIIYGHISSPEGTIEDEEKQADEYAKNTLIPAQQYQQFVMEDEFSKAAILDFSKKIEIDAGIVVGRLQKEGYIQYNWHNDLKTKYVLTA